MRAGRPSRRRVRSGRQRIPAWIILLLAGPVIWYLYFWVVYLGAEAMCAARPDQPGVLGVPLLSALVIVATLVTLAPIVWFALAAKRVDSGQGHRGELARTGSMIGFIFAFATLFVGLPAFFLVPC